MRRHLSVVGVLVVVVLAGVYGALGVPLTLGSAGPADSGSPSDAAGMANVAGSNSTTTTASAATTTADTTTAPTTATATATTDDTTTTDDATTTRRTTTPTSTEAASASSGSSSGASASQTDDTAETTTASSSGSAGESDQPAEHYVIVRGGSPSNVVDYQLTATGSVTQSEGRSGWPVSSDSVSVDPEDSVDGRTATGTLGGGADAFWYDGDLSCFQVSDQSAVTVYVDGEEVAVGSVAGGTHCDSSSSDDDSADTGDDGSDSDGDGEADTSDEPNVSFPSCTEVRIDGLEDSGWEVEYVSIRVWLLDDWTRDGPPPIDTHMIGLPQNDTGPVYTYENDGFARGNLYIVDSVTLVSPDGERVEWTNPHDCEFVVGVGDNGTVSQPRDGT